MTPTASTPQASRTDSGAAPAPRPSGLLRETASEGRMRGWLRHGLLPSLIAIASFHLAYTFSALSFLILVYLGCLFQLTRLPTARIAFYSGFVTGFGCALQASFFWNIFGPTAIALWCILAFWTGLFVVLSQITRVRLGKTAALLLIPFLWTGLEYFRSELYYLRFSWLNAGYVFAPNLPLLPVKYLGMYGVGFVLMAFVSLSELLHSKARVAFGAMLMCSLAVMVNLPAPREMMLLPPPARNLSVAGIQFEFPSEPQALEGLNQLVEKCPDADLLVLSEYTFTTSIPESVKNWCRKNHRYLIVGGEDPVSTNQYRNTAFVVDPNGNIVFQQAKSVPIQFFNDGLPAASQKLWDSPWGKIGICICYDLSYTRVTDELIRLGAQAIIVPSMDVIDWGRHQHELHARVAPIRAAEYSVPIFRLASSGISQYVSRSGREFASTPVPGDGAIISATLNLAKPGTLPIDRFLAPLAVVIDTLLAGWLIFLAFVKNKKAASEPANPSQTVPSPLKGERVRVRGVTIPEQVITP